MGLRITSGWFRSRRIGTPRTSRTHPMGDRIRSSLFNKIATELVDATVLDAFAGSGALGLEALSRGAKHSTFIDKDRIAQKVIAKNIELLGVENRTKLIRSSVSGWLGTSDDEQEFDIIFADPPYHDLQLGSIARLTKLLKPDGLMVLSLPNGAEAPEYAQLTQIDARSYGDATLTFYRK